MGKPMGKEDVFIFFFYTNKFNTIEKNVMDVNPEFDFFFF